MGRGLREEAWCEGDRGPRMEGVPTEEVAALGGKPGMSCVLRRRGWNIFRRQKGCTEDKEGPLFHDCSLRVCYE